MRVIGGVLKGKKLFTPRGRMLRPTADRVRESIFNILSDRVAGATVCDLYAGTGAFGIEALSRGARSAVFIDHHRSALDLVRGNLDQCGIREQARVIRWDIRRNLHCLKAGPDAFDLVFLDPPYRRDLVAITLHHLLESNSLDPDAWVVAEHAPGEAIALDSPKLQIFDQRRYGKTLVSFFGPVV